MKRELARKDEDIKNLGVRVDGNVIMLNGLQRDFDINGAKKTDLLLLHQELREIRREQMAGFERMYDKIDEKADKE